MSSKTKYTLSFSPTGQEIVNYYRYGKSFCDVVKRHNFYFHSLIPWFSMIFHNTFPLLIFSTLFFLVSYISNSWKLPFWIQLLTECLVLTFLHFRFIQRRSTCFVYAKQYINIILKMGYEYMPLLPSLPYPNQQIPSQLQLP